MNNTDAKLELAIEEYLSSTTRISTTYLGNKYGIDRHLISKELKDRNIKMWGRKLTPEIEQEVIQEYLKKPCKISDVCFICRLSEPTVIKVLTKHSIPRWNRGLQFSPDLKEDFFEKIDTEEKAYYLGLIVTDGCLHEDKCGKKMLALTLQEEDKYLLDKFVELIQSNKKVTSDGRGCYGIQIISDKVFDDLLQYGLKPRKSFETVFPKLEESLYPHFIRGVLDGDGSIGFHSRPDRKVHRKTMRICSACEEFLTDIATYLSKKLEINNPPIYRELEHTSARQIVWTRNADLEKLYFYLYSNATVFMKRKKEVFNKIIEEIRQYRDN